MSERPVLITDARISADDELDHRRRRYILTMLMRIPFLIGAGIFTALHVPWLAITLTNDGPARNAKPRKVLPGTISYERAIEARHHVIDSDLSDPDKH